MRHCDRIEKVLPGSSNQIDQVLHTYLKMQTVVTMEDNRKEGFRKRRWKNNTRGVGSVLPWKTLTSNLSLNVTLSVD